jgi:uncharacterized glyoxalase superfamily protein PhnB
MTDFKPQGCSSVSPYFVVNGAQELADLLKGIFGAEELRRYDRPDGAIVHIELKIDDSVILLGGALADISPNQLLTHIYVPDVDATFRKATQLGCSVVEKPKLRDGDRDKRGSFKDFAGNVWSIGTQREYLETAT